ncbi:MAG: hypothetical protein ACTSPL_08130, partial [Candidatus Odinarchaeia archaeon]
GEISAFNFTYLVYLRIAEVEKLIEEAYRTLSELRNPENLQTLRIIWEMMENNLETINLRVNKISNLTENMKQHLKKIENTAEKNI